jgi:hypothetical protein
MTALPEIGKHYRADVINFPSIEGTCVDVYRTPAGANWDYYAVLQHADGARWPIRFTSRAVDLRRTPKAAPTRREVADIPDAEAIFPGGEDA